MCAFFSVKDMFFFWAPMKQTTLLFFIRWHFSSYKRP